MSRPFRIAIVGDVHLHWDARDAEALEREGYDLVLFVGDLATHRPRRAIEVGRRIARLRIPGLVIPGNHDVGVPLQRAALGLGLDGLARALAERQRRDVAAMRSALGDVALGGYSSHRYEREGLPPVQVLVARPHSIGGPRLGYPAYLRAAFGVASFDDSAALLAGLLEEAEPGPLIVLAHGGPSGLGGGRGAIWGRGRDRDFGDGDLRSLLDHAATMRREVAAVVAGHLHHRPRRGELRRPAFVRAEGSIFVNAAEVPRHRARDGRDEAYHVALTLEGDTMSVAERWIPLG